MQSATGVRSRAEAMGQRMIRAQLSAPEAAFFEALTFLVVGSLDCEGRPWASFALGAPGFVNAIAPERLQVEVAARQPLANALLEQAPLGLLGIDLARRRRVRVNGRAATCGEAGFQLQIDQVFGNCPQYITPRPSIAAANMTAATELRRESSLLSPAAHACIEQADTCFIASASSAFPTRGDPREGVDVSHRGGPPGFVQVRDDAGATHLLLPDYAGNNAFNTLGNLLRYPRAGLLFPQFQSGDLLHLTCQTELVLEGPLLAAFPEAKRLVTLRVTEGLLHRGGLHAPPSER